MKRILLFLILFISYRPVLYGENRELVFLLKDKTEFSKTEQDSIISLYKEAEKNNLFPDIIYNRITEGAAKRVSYNKFYSIIFRKLEKIKWIKKFCGDSGGLDLRVPYKRKTADKLLFILDNNMNFQDITYFHKLSSEHKVRAGEFLKMLKKTSLLNVRGIDKKHLKILFEESFSSGKSYRYINRILNVLMKTGNKDIKEAGNVILEGIRKNRNIFEIEDELRLRNLEQNNRRSIIYSIRDERNEVLRKKRTGRNK